MSYYPGQGHQHNGNGGYPPYQQGPPPPQQPYYAPPQDQQYYGPPGGPPPSQHPGYGPPPGNYYQQGPPPVPQHPSYGAPPAYPLPQGSPGFAPPHGSPYGPPQGSPGFGPPGYPPPQGGPQYAPPQHGYSQGGFPPTGTNPPSQMISDYAHTGNNRPPMPSVQNNSYNRGNHNAPPPPPQGPQSFGQGAPNYQWVPSKCNGRRKALLIGINYFGQSGQLRGCINDVQNMKTFLNERFGYAKEDMVILTDDQQNPRSQPTKQNIIQAMTWLVKDARPDDSLFFHYSGHGGQTKDLDGDEQDGNDETIYPVDFKSAGHIVDDDMHRIMVMPLAPGVRLTAIFDSCHSGSVLDLPYLYSTKGTLKEPDLAKEAGTGLLGALMSYGRGDLGGVASSAMGFFKSATTGSSAHAKSRRTKTSPADVIQWSGSKDIQTSADAVENGQATGAMSYAFITALKKNPQQSYQQLLQSIRQELEGRYDQKPQLSCSHPLDTRTLYVM